MEENKQNEKAIPLDFIREFLEKKEKENKERGLDHFSEYDYWGYMMINELIIAWNESNKNGATT